MMLREGQYVTITYKGRDVEARVVIVSKNQKAIAFGFDTMLGGYVGMMAALDKGDGFRDLIENELVEVRP
jgi:hypothetical protein